METDSDFQILDTDVQDELISHINTYLSAKNNADDVRMYNSDEVAEDLARQNQKEYHDSIDENSIWARYMIGTGRNINSKRFFIF